MRTFLPRAPRITTAVSVTILLLETASDRVVAEPVPGTLRNISTGGACVEVSSPLSSGHHLFYQTLNSKKFYLLLQGIVPCEQPSAFSVQAISVWMKAAEEDDPPGFQVGVQFREKQTALFRKFQGM